MPSTECWRGRIDSKTDLAQFRLHQIVQMTNLNEAMTKESSFCIIGFESDEGVKRNKGRVGASEAPNEIRKALAAIPVTLGSGKKLMDAGNIICENEDLESAQEELGQHLSRLYQYNKTPLILGGGHETLYGHYLGARNFIGPDASLGIINIDAHFDLRDDERPSSGTMFKQILANDPNSHYLCLGIQELANTKALFQSANEYNCKYILEEDITKNHYEATFKAIDEFSQHDYVIVTLCTDSILASAAPGVSAPSPFGLEPKVVRTLLRYIVSKRNVLSFDLSEVNPRLDLDGRTTKLAALLIAEAMNHFHK
ncbi:formimidoylglutamase [Bacillus tianshenii]|nr:formimidoylglutamase [Bacillus tianshenii]